MKKRMFIRLLVATGVLLSVSCNVSNDSTGKSGKPELYGKWEWVRTTGGFAGVTSTPQSTKNKVMLTLFPNQTFGWYINDTLWAHGGISFTTVAGDSAIAFHPKEDVTIFTKIYSINGNGELNLLDECYDCYYYTFKKSQ